MYTQSRVDRLITELQLVCLLALIASVCFICFSLSFNCCRLETYLHQIPSTAYEQYSFSSVVAISSTIQQFQQNFSILCIIMCVRVLMVNEMYDSKMECGDDFDDNGEPNFLLISSFLSIISHLFQQTKRKSAVQSFLSD